MFKKFTKFKCSFHSPQVKQNLITIIKNFIYELTEKFPNELRVVRQIFLQYIKMLKPKGIEKLKKIEREKSEILEKKIIIELEIPENK